MVKRTYKNPNRKIGLLKISSNQINEGDYMLLNKKRQVLYHTSCRFFAVDERELYPKGTTTIEVKHHTYH